MADALYFFTQAELEQRLTKSAVRNILDDNEDGVADVDNVTALRRDASAYVSGYMRGIYTLPLQEPVSSEVKRLALDVAEAYAAKRHPEYVRGRDWQALLNTARTELCDVRSGKTRLDISPATEPSVAPSNVGGTVGSAIQSDTTTTSSGGTTTTETTPGSHWSNMGDF